MNDKQRGAVTAKGLATPAEKITMHPAIPRGDSILVLDIGAGVTIFHVHT